MGRITNYRPELCDQLIAKMSQGLTFMASCADLGISPAQASSWQKLHAEFVEARNLGNWKHQLFYERLLQHSAMGIIPEDLKVVRNGKEVTKKSRGVNTLSVQFALSRVHPEQYGAERLKSTGDEIGEKIEEIEQLEKELEEDLARYGFVRATKGRTAQDKSKNPKAKAAQGESEPD